MTSWIPFVVALLSSLVLIPLVREFSIRSGKVVKPREDRWNRRAIPTLGGIGVFIAFLAGICSALIFIDAMTVQNTVTVNYTVHRSDIQRNWGFLAGSVFIFGLGVYDDFKRLSPQAKLIGQIIAATIVISLGFTTQFFTPRISNPILAQLPNILLTFIWLIGITNAINLLDNMDGLAGGISLITAGFLGFLFWQAGNILLLVVATALAGAILGFLVYNFPPAKIFMGDSGSMFIGFTLAVLAIVRQPQASNVFAIMAVPTLLFLLPIADTAFVSFTRLIRGQSPAVGGRDHTSHRLIAFGLNERQTLLVLYGVALISGILALTIETLGYWLSLIFVPLLVIALALLIAYLAGIRSDADSERSATIGSSRLLRLMVDLTFRRRILEIFLDFLIILAAYYLAFIAHYGIFLSEAQLDLYLQSLPIALAGAFIAFFYFGIYRAIWRYVGLEEVVRYAKAGFGAMLLVGAMVTLVYWFRTRQGQFLPEAFSPLVFLLFGVFLFLGLVASRSSFRVLDLFSRSSGKLIDYQEHRDDKDGHRQPVHREQKVLIIGAGDAGEMALRWIAMNPELHYKPVGFLDRDPFKVGRKIHGVDILGNLDQLDTILKARQVQGVILTDLEILADFVNLTDDIKAQSGIAGPSEELMINKVEAACRNHECWLRTLRLEFELIK